MTQENPTTPNATLPLQLLAALIARAFDLDPTEPPDWKSAKLLRELDIVFLHGQKNFKGYAALLTEASKMCPDPTATALLKRGAFNCARREPNASAEEVLAAGMELDRQFRALPKTNRSRWLVGINSYDLGILCRDAGKFEAAMNFQQEAADRFAALGDGPSVSISTFLVAVEHANNALYQGREVKEALEKLDQAYGPASEALKGHGWAPNVWMHAIFVHVWGADDLDYAGFEKQAEFFLSAGDNPYQLHWRGLVAAIRDLREGNAVRAMYKLQTIVARAETDCDGELTCTALLLKARVFGEASLRADLMLDAVRMLKAATKAYRQLLDWNGLKGHVPRAIGARELTALYARTTS